MSKAENLPATKDKDSLIQKLNKMVNMLEKITEPEDIIAARAQMVPISAYIKHIKATRSVAKRAAELALRIEIKLGKWLINHTRTKIKTPSYSPRKGGAEAITPDEVEKKYGITGQQQAHLLSVGKIDEGQLQKYCTWEENRGRIPSAAKLRTWERQNERIIRHNDGETRWDKGLPDGEMVIDKKGDKQYVMKIRGVSHVKLYLVFNENNDVSTTTRIDILARTICSSYNERRRQTSLRDVVKRKEY